MTADYKPSAWQLVLRVGSFRFASTSLNHKAIIKSQQGEKSLTPSAPDLNFPMQTSCWYWNLGLPYFMMLIDWWLGFWSERCLYGAWSHPGEAYVSKAYLFLWYKSGPAAWTIDGHEIGWFLLDWGGKEFAEACWIGTQKCVNHLAFWKVQAESELCQDPQFTLWHSPWLDNSASDRNTYWVCVTIMSEAILHKSIHNSSWTEERRVLEG